MKRLLSIICLLSLVACAEQVPVKRKYYAGDKILLKTGDVGVILGMPYKDSWTYDKGTKQPRQRYVVRIGFVKRMNNTDALFRGRQTVTTDITKFTIWEFEIEKKVD